MTPEKPKGGVVGWVIGIFAVLLIIGIAAHNQPQTTPSGPQAATPTATPVAPAGAATPAEATPQITYEPPSQAAIDRAASEAKRVYAAEGLSGLSHYGELCFDALARDGTFYGLDYCLAFDSFAVRLATGAPAYVAAPGGYFADADRRGLAAAAATMKGQGDAGARLADVRRLAEGVSLTPPPEPVPSADVLQDSTASAPDESTPP